MKTIVLYAQTAVTTAIDSLASVAIAPGPVNWNLWMAIGGLAVLSIVGGLLRKQLAAFVDHTLGPVLTPMPLFGPNYKARVYSLVAGVLITFFEMVASGFKPNGTLLLTAWSQTFVVWRLKGDNVHTLPSGQQIVVPQGTSVATSQTLPMNVDPASAGTYKAD